MADEADHADEYIQQMLANPRNPYERQARIRPNGLCHNCYEIVATTGQLFCDKECADEWGERDAARIRNGG